MVKRKENKEHTLQHTIFVSFGLIIGAAILLFAVLLSLGISYVFTNNNGILIALCVVLPFLLLFIILASFALIRSSYTVIYQNLYKNTLANYNLLLEDKRTINKYPENNLVEFKDLNKKIDELYLHTSTLSISNSVVDYSKIPLEYFDKKRNFINETSLRKYIREIIYVTAQRRNAVVSISYEDYELESKAITEILSYINKSFPAKYTLIALKDKGNGFYLYIPSVESLSLIKEQLEGLLQNLTVAKKSINGIDLLVPRINVVCYPYSSIQDIFSDLHYSERQNKEINIYIPNRFNEAKNDTLLQSSLNSNNISKIISIISDLKSGKGDFDDFLNRMGKALNEMIRYLNIEQSGVVMFNKELNYSTSSLCVTINDQINPIFPKNKEVKKTLVDAIFNSVDPDNSVFFSSRKNVNSKLGKELDIYGINSGYFYVIKDTENKIIGFIYFVNTSENFYPDIYVLESLLVVCNLLSSFTINNMFNMDLVAMRERESNLLKLTNIRSYTIDRNTYEIKAYSPSLKKDIPEIEVGDICYKTMFGLDKPCANCPLVSKQKALKKIRNVDVEVSYSINTKFSNLIELILNLADKNNVNRNRFDPDFLINTFYSFSERLNDLYSANARGYIALLRITNASELIQKLGNEGYSFLIRCFTTDVNKKLLNSNEIYLYKSDTLAIIFNEFGKLDVIDVIEKIYEFSKKKYFPNEEVCLDIRYEAVKYPQEHANKLDLIRHLEIVGNKYDNKGESDTLYIEENDFLRPASKEGYILSIINQATIQRNFIIKAQPVVLQDKQIFGAEILIRLSDEYSNSLLNTDELIAVAAKNDKLNYISDMLIDYVGQLFKQFGYSIFKSTGFNRMSINVDFNYFRDKNFINKILGSVNKYHFPKNFLTFELSEKEISEHYDQLFEVIRTLRQNDINIVCDHYFGDLVSFNKLNELDIHEIKVDRRVLVDIDVSSDKLQSLKMLTEAAEAQKIKITMVGVENGQQYSLIENFGSNCYLQGYYFHHPMNANELIEVIRSDASIK